MYEDTVSIIVTALNGEKWIDSCFRSILQQCIAVHMQNHFIRSLVTTAAKEEEMENRQQFQIEVCVFDDCSQDSTAEMLTSWQHEFHEKGIRMHIVLNESGKSKGVGYGRNRAIEVASGAYLCFQDIDDEMLPTRIQQQYALARCNKDALIGSKFVRAPANSTCRFTRWANDLDVSKLPLQIYTANGPTVIMPTWFCHRQVYEHIPDFMNTAMAPPKILSFFMLISTTVAVYARQ